MVSLLMEMEQGTIATSSVRIFASRAVRILETM